MSPNTQECESMEGYHTAIEHPDYEHENEHAHQYSATTLIAPLCCNVYS